MVAPRRLGMETSKTRAVLVDAAERLLIEEGYAAVTSRKVAAKAGLKPPLVHYYFRTMDDLFLAVYRRRAEEGLAHMEEVLKSPQPLWALWDFNREPLGVGVMMEFVALANHRKSIRAEITAYAERVRRRQVEAVSTILEAHGVEPDERAMVVVVMLSSIARLLVIERETLELSTGHRETVAVVERYLQKLEGDRVPVPKLHRVSPTGSG